MNTAWVGVIGAAVGGGIAGVTAIGTSYFQLRVSKEQLKAQKKEADQQRHYESLVERRTAKADVYEAFMLEAQNLTEAISANLAMAKRTGNPLPVVPTGQSASGLTRKNTSVAIQGPEMVAVTADAVLMSVIQLAPLTFVPGPTGNEARVMELFSRLSQRLSQFNDEARAALEDHGQEPSGQA